MGMGRASLRFELWRRLFLSSLVLTFSATFYLFFGVFKPRFRHFRADPPFTVGDLGWESELARLLS